MNDLLEKSLCCETTAPVSIGFTREKPMFEESPVNEEDMKLIHRFAPGRLDPNQVYTRSMYLCSTQPCLSDGCQFTRNALEEICERIVGLSVLTGHDRSSLPLARFYKAAVVQQGGCESGEPVFFVRAWFYWLRDTTGAKDLLLNIDGGIYREASLAWRFDSWRCSVCQAPNGSCGHRVGSLYNGTRCFRLIDRITEVLEGSLVYKSADRNTYLAGSRSLETASQTEPVLLIGSRYDPLFSLLERADAVQESNDLEDLREPLSQSVESFWVRLPATQSCERLAEILLVERGDCLAEIYNPGTQDEPLWGNLLCLSVSDGGSLQSRSLEDNHGAIRTV